MPTRDLHAKRGGAAEVERPRLYKIADACRSLGISRSYLYELIARGELRTVRLGSVQRITAQELDRYVAELQRRAAS